MLLMNNKTILPLQTPQQPQRFVPATPKAVLAFIFCAASIGISIYVLYSYISFFNDAIKSDLPEIGLFQAGVLFWLFFPTVLAVILALVGRFLVRKKQDPHKVIKVISVISIWLSFAFFSIHTITLWAYITIAIVVSTIAYLAESSSFESKKQKLSIITIIVLVELLMAIGVSVLLSSVTTLDPTLQLLFTV